MSGQANDPLLTPPQAGQLLDDVIFTRVVSLIDLPELYDFEALLALQIESLGADHARARRTAKAMVDRALVRVARTPRRWTTRGSPPNDDACGLCGDLPDPTQQEPPARPQQEPPARPQQEPPARSKQQPAARSTRLASASAPRTKASRTGA